MKKVLALLAVALFSVSAFAMNAAAPADEKCPGKATFEKYVASQENESFIAQNILINLSDPMESMTDEEALPLAACYQTYRVKGQTLVEFVRSHAEIFPGDIHKVEAKKLYNFAARVEALNEKVAFDKMASQPNEYFIAQNILINLADPFSKLSDEQAAFKAKYYLGFKVKNEPMISFAKRFAQHYSEFEELNDFVGRIEFFTR